MPRDAGVPARDVGMTGGARLIVDGVLDLALADAARAWRDAIPTLVGGDVPVAG